MNLIIDNYYNYKHDQRSKKYKQDKKKQKMNLKYINKFTNENCVV